MSAPAGWYPDPSNASQQRYWNGAAWTEHVAPIAPAAPVTSAEPASLDQTVIRPSFTSAAPVAPVAPGVEEVQSAPTAPSPPAAPPAPPVYATSSPAAAGTYAHWGQRALGAIIDGLLTIAVTIIPAAIGLAVMMNARTQEYDVASGTVVLRPPGWSIALYLVLTIVPSFTFVIWNQVFKQGRTGQSIGKRVIGIRLVKEQAGTPLGAGLTFVRQIAHVLDSMACYLGWLWPLWDSKHQTFADKVMGSVVLEAPKADTATTGFNS